MNRAPSLVPDSQHAPEGSSRPDHPAVIFVGAQERVWTGLLRVFNKTYALTTSANTKLPTLGIKFVHLQRGGDTDDDITEFGDHPLSPKSLDVYCIPGPLPQSNTQSYLAALFKLVPAHAHFVYIMDATTTWKSLTTLLNLRTTVTNAKSQILPLIKSTIGPACHVTLQSLSLVVLNTASWSYTANTMPRVDFVQQLLRSTFLGKGGKLVYLPNEATFDRGPLVDLLAFILKSAPPHDTTSLTKYCQLEIDVRFDSQAKISLLDESFDWEGTWNDLWEAPLPSDKTESAAEHLVSASPSFRDYFNARLSQLHQKQDLRTTQ